VGAGPAAPLLEREWRVGFKGSHTAETKNQQMLRCCGTPGEPAPCYASVLVAGTCQLGEAVARVEEGPITPCVTAWCHRCRKHSLLVRRAGDFPCFSAFVAHALALHALVARDQ